MERFQNLDLQDLNSNPFEQFSLWFADAKKHIALYPEAMSVATLDAKGYPQTRYVLFRGYKPPVFQFFTNYSSDKGQQLEKHPKASLLFYWKEIGRQVRITGDVQKSSKEDSDAYWNTRPQESQIHAMVSDQSSPLASLDIFLNAVKSKEDKYIGQKIPRPENWGGFDVTAQSFEFWQEGEFRLHHRFRYEKSGNYWGIERLNP
jgi:pyridoxamine 5'-phosphate oxidase